MRTAFLALLLSLLGVQAWADAVSATKLGQEVAVGVAPGTNDTAPATPVAAGNATPANGPATVTPGSRRWADLPYGAGYEARQRGYGWRGGRGHGRR